MYLVMSETQTPGPNVLTELPLEVSAERAQEVGAYFRGILDQYGKPAEIPVGGKLRTNMWDGFRAEFTNGDTRFTVEHIDNDITRRNGMFPEIVASIYAKTSRDYMGKSVKAWQLGDRFAFNPDDNSLSYKNGSAFLFVFSDKPLKPGVEGVQRTGKRGKITANVTPPTPEGVVATLDSFLESSKQIIAESQRPTRKLRALGHRAVNTLFARN